jgi:hypothetical protein
MAGVAGCTLEYITIDVPVITGKLTLVVVFMTINTAKKTIVAGRSMAVCTGIPLTAVVAAVDGKKLFIVVDESGRAPTRRGGVAKCTISREARGLMVGVLRCLIVR